MLILSFTELQVSTLVLSPVSKCSNFTFIKKAKTNKQRAPFHMWLPAQCFIWTDIPQKKFMSTTSWWICLIAFDTYSHLEIGPIPLLAGLFPATSFSISSIQGSTASNGCSRHVDKVLMNEEWVKGTQALLFGLYVLVGRKEDNSINNSKLWLIYTGKTKSLEGEKNRKTYFERCP